MKQVLKYFNDKSELNLITKIIGKDGVEAIGKETALQIGSTNFKQAAADRDAALKDFATSEHVTDPKAAFTNEFGTDDATDTNPVGAAKSKLMAQKSSEYPVDDNISIKPNIEAKYKTDELIIRAAELRYKPEIVDGKEYRNAEIPVRLESYINKIEDKYKLPELEQSPVISQLSTDDKVQFKQTKSADGTIMTINPMFAPKENEVDAEIKRLLDSLTPHVEVPSTPLEPSQTHHENLNIISVNQLSKETMKQVDIVAAQLDALLAGVPQDTDKKGPTANTKAMDTTITR